MNEKFEKEKNARDQKLRYREKNFRRIKKILFATLSFAIALGTISSYQILPTVDAMSFSTNDDEENRAFCYHEDSKIISATVSTHGAMSLETIHRYFIAFIDPAVIEGFGVNDEHKIVSKEDEDNGASIGEIIDEGYEIYIFALDNNTIKDATVTMHSYSEDNMIQNYENDGTVSGDKDLLGSGKTIADLWQQKDWAIVMGPNWSNEEWEMYNCYSLDYYFGEVSEVFSVDSIEDDDDTVKHTNKYELVIPAETSSSENTINIESEGYTQLKGCLNVKNADLNEDRCISVSAEVSAFKRTDKKADGTPEDGSIEFNLKYEDGSEMKNYPSDGLIWTASEAKDDGKPVTIGIDIDEQEYLAAPDGEYEGSIKWTAKLQLAD